MHSYPANPDGIAFVLLLPPCSPAADELIGPAGGGTGFFGSSRLDWEEETT
jgi:hypothetical protein